MATALRATQRNRAVEFRDAVVSSEPEAQRNVAPFLSSPVLRKIVMTFSNDPRGDFAQWANNPRVLEMLKRLQGYLDEGRMTEEEAERLLVRSRDVLQRSSLIARRDLDFWALQTDVDIDPKNWLSRGIRLH